MLANTRVTTVDGVLQGKTVADLVTWRGIPYAAPPVGPLRLRAPQPVAPWTGVRDATEWGNASVQHKRGTMLSVNKYQPSSEDCLTLNVLAPGRRSVGSLPVMVFIHGGAYTLGTSATPLYGGGSLVRRALKDGDGIVYVSINYRLGTLGYLDFSQFSTPTRQFDSNLGLRDQVAALEWVQRNISAFGGDPDNVTVFGESAGGNAVTTLLATPSAKGLFARAIAESSAPGLVATQDRATDWARQFVELLGDGGNVASTLDSADVKTLGSTGSKLALSVVKSTPGLHPFGPVVDGDFLPKNPVDACADGTAHAVPLIIGTNGREGTLFPKVLDALPTNPSRIDTLFALTDPAAKDVVLEAYPDYPQESAAIDVGGDFTFWKPSIEVAETHSRRAPTYSYRFDFAPRVMKWLGLDATHGFELFAVFGINETSFGKLMTVPGGRRAFQEVTEHVQSQWLEFARTGSPLPSWPKYDESTRETLIFDTRTRVQRDPRSDRRRAWEGYRGYASQKTEASAT
ncbi:MULTISPECIES: carboxylesterase/lipase family protein [Nocardiaceae]|uniref:carboxylesterase/lipase family protein n=1 Tax=Nocardiaceae TaxID=85025 RepID=UPI00035DCA58|nr:MULTISPECIES: carboxylesterase/lipase family protein [Rhodococcus]OZC88200.1 carboxylesterase/lipase family protein [Rhodococcus sp. 06-418-1B]OZD11771.1 carboxylesterase/lipase family protein [Rhodococcus sp. 06-156-4C]OZD15615.1 carboxylesterase/lipase family protein [Rhodococcus sp. 06-156-4a]OZD23781.1 carboxylesterase/lipase family protein [Rhodococcus sp. 06-156-3C]OZD27147.1 carboxylesterase/lipase family protein [Rhodococcus sp. 06-156-3b]